MLLGERVRFCAAVMRCCVSRASNLWVATLLAVSGVSLAAACKHKANRNRLVMVPRCGSGWSGAWSAQDPSEVLGGPAAGSGGVSRSPASFGSRPDPPQPQKPSA